MKKLLLIIILCLIPTTTNAQLSTFLELQSNSDEPYKQFTVDGGISYKFNSNIGIKLFFLTKAKWGEVYIGPSFSSKIGNLVLSGNVGIGVEQSKNGFYARFAGGLFVAYSNFSFLGLVEFNKNVFDGSDKGVWYDLHLLYKITPCLKIGLIDRRPSGFGPQVRFTLLKHIEFWIAWTPIKSETGKYESLLIFGAKGMVSL